MSVFHKSSEVLEEVKKRENDVFHCMYDESKDFWYFSLGNANQEVDYFGLLYGEEGIRFLLDYFLWKRNLSLEGNLDTIRVSYHERLLGYIRHIKQNYMVEVSPQIVERLLYKVLSAFESVSSSISIAHNPNHIKGSLLLFSGSQRGQNFIIESEQDQTARLDYLLKEYTKNHPNSRLFENEREYYFERISFGKEGLLKEKKDLLELYQKRGYQDGKSASLIRELYQSVQRENTRRKKF